MDLSELFIIFCMSLTMHIVFGLTFRYLSRPILYYIIVLLILPLITTICYDKYSSYGIFPIVKLWSLAVLIFYIGMLKYSRWFQGTYLYTHRTEIVYMLFVVNILEAMTVEYSIATGPHNFINIMVGGLLFGLLWLKYRYAVGVTVEYNRRFPSGTQLECDMTFLWCLAYCIWNSNYILAYSPSDLYVFFLVSTLIFPLLGAVFFRIDFVEQRVTSLLAYILIRYGAPPYFEPLKFYETYNNPKSTYNLFALGREPNVAMFLAVLGLVVVLAAYIDLYLTIKNHKHKTFLNDRMRFRIE